MRRALFAVLAASPLVLAGCPLPQALPEYNAGGNTPPRIVADDQLTPGIYGFDGAVTLVPADCTTIAPSYTLAARINDPNTVESVEARWFVNYDHHDAPWNEIQNNPPTVIAPNADTTNLIRPVPAWTFRPYKYPPPYGRPKLSGPDWTQEGVVRVVELVVSNGFDPAVSGTTAAANRAPKPKFETQVYRWVFLTVPESKDVPCPH